MWEKRPGLNRWSYFYFFDIFRFMLLDSFGISAMFWTGLRVGENQINCKWFTLIGDKLWVWKKGNIYNTRGKVGWKTKINKIVSFIFNRFKNYFYKHFVFLWWFVIYDFDRDVLKLSLRVCSSSTNQQTVCLLFILCFFCIL